MKKLLMLSVFALLGLSTIATAQPNACGVQANITSACGNNNNGAIDIVLLNPGPGTYTYLWSNGATTQDLVGVPVGTYSVTVTYLLNGNGCQSFYGATVGANPTTTYYRDFDGDGYGNPAVTLLACTQPAGYVANNTDCNDNNAAIKPGATEVCDNIDNDCDGLTDEGLLITYYRDADGDGFGNSALQVQFCLPVSGYVTNNLDCNDNNALERPGQVWYADFDNDGYGHSFSSPIIQCLRPFGYKVATELTATTGDCNDFNPAIRPGATEVCNGIDDDCDGAIDENGQNTYYRDADGDGYGNPAIFLLACTQPAGYVSNNTDCDDGDYWVNPNTIWYLDADGDHYYTGSGVTQCASPGAGYRYTDFWSGGGDCNDNNPNVNPGVPEICNGIDDNCDGQIDEVAPVANFSWALNGTNVQFTNLSTSAQQFAWSFGDGSTSHTVPNPIHTYTAPGNYWVSLTVINCATGCPPSIFTALVTIPGCDLPVASFSFSEPGTTTVNFVDQSTGSPTQWLWNFGDGTTATAQNPGNHIFPSPGSYTVILTVTNTCGSHSISNIVVVDAPPCTPATILVAPQNFSVRRTNGWTTLTVVPQGVGHTIQWTPVIGAGSTTATNFTYQVDLWVLGYGPHTFNWVVNQNTACPVVGQVVVTVTDNQVTSTDEPGLQEASQEGIVAYPNPTTGEVALAGITNGTPVQIYNTTGQLIEEQNYLENMDLSDLPSGVYFLRVLGRRPVKVVKI